MFAGPWYRPLKRALIALPVVATLVRPVTAQDSLHLARIDRIGALRSPALHESSGVAISRAHPGLLWTHNDSGDSAVVYAMNQQGDLLGSYRVRGARAVDWEDMALGSCPEGNGACLYLADTGDNNESRTSVVIYIVPEPEPPAGGGPSARGDTQTARAVTIRYPDGSHDVEAVAVDPAGDLYLVTKGRTAPIRLYRVPRAALLDSSADAILADRLPIDPLQTIGRWVTGAAISPTGDRLVVRTYTELYFFHRSAGKYVPDGPPCWLGAAEPQGEAVDFIDESAVLLTSETVHNQLGPILRVTCTSGSRPAR